MDAEPDGGRSGGGGRLPRPTGDRPPRRRWPTRASAAADPRRPRTALSAAPPAPPPATDGPSGTLLIDSSLMRTRNHRCGTMDELLDLTFDWFATRTHFRIETTVYGKSP